MKLAAEFGDCPQLRLSEAVVYTPQRFVDATPGRIATDLMAQAHARGALDEVRCDFTPEHDSNGAEWAARVSAQYPLGVSYLAVLEAMQDQAAAAFELTPDAVLRLTVPVPAA